MKFAIIADIHGNLEAFKAVLADIDVQGCAEVFCAGDLVGYGPDPQAVVELAISRGIQCTLGNHDQAIIDPASLSWFNPHARAAIEQTAKLLSGDIKAFLASLPYYLVKHGCRFVHGFPPKSVKTYLFEPDDRKLRRTLEEMEEQVCFVGHSHELEFVGLRGDRLMKERLPKGFKTLESGRYIVNVGSVGQPRDGDRSAKYCTFDTEARLLDVRFVAYDAQATVDKMRAMGLPESNALRLL